MLSEKKPDTGQGRCYRCGSLNVESICHHCGRPMCITHSSMPKRGLRRSHLNLEMRALGLKKKDIQTPVHCRYCQHKVYIPSIMSVVVGTFAVLACLAPALLSPLLSVWELTFCLIGAALGIGLSAGSLLIGRRKRDRYSATRPPLPLKLKPQSIGISENIHARVALDSDGKLSSRVDPVEGKLILEAKVPRPKKNLLGMYLRKLGIQASQARYHAGFFLLKGMNSIEITKERVVGSTAVPLIGKVEDLPLDESGRLSKGVLEIERSYRLRRGSPRIPLPATITPSLQPDNLRCLNLEIDWIDPFNENRAPDVKEIEEFELRVPAAWGQAIHLMPEGALSSRSDDKRYRTITWTKVAIGGEWRENGRGSFSIRFEKDLTKELEQHNNNYPRNMLGQVKLSYDQSFSGLDAISLFAPSGVPRSSSETIDNENMIFATIEFDFDLMCLDYHLSHMIAESQEQLQQGFVFKDVALDHATVISLTNALVRNEYYVRRVVEDEPNIDAESRRSWEIAGRRYRGVWPIDFRLRLYGGTDPCSVRILLTVRGGYNSPDMKEHIENAWEQVKELVGTTMNQYH